MLKGRCLTPHVSLISGLFFLLFCFSVVCSYGATQADFYDLMGKKQEVWKAVLKEDFGILDRFSLFFEKTAPEQMIEASIPKRIHFIWVGPKEFPKGSIKNVYSWIEKNPDFEVYFWTDRERPLPHPFMKLRSVQDFDWLFLREQFAQSNNYAEQSDLLRYEILYQEGGVYVDHDIECFKPFAGFIKSFDLFCGLEFPHKPIGATSITVCNNLIGSCPNHPILKKTIESVLQGWDRTTLLYPENDVDSVVKRVYYRTFSPFDESVKMLFDEVSHRNGVLPAGYFNKIGKQFGLYAHHQYASSWFETETSFEKNVRQRLVKICKKSNQIMLISFAFFMLSFLIVLILAFQVQSLKKELKRLHNQAK